MMGILGKSRFCQLALVAVVSVAVAGSEAMAWSYGSWGSSGGSYGSSGSSASYGSSGSSASYSSHGSHGGGLFARIRARRAARASYGSHGSSASSGSYGSHGSSASYGGYGSSASYGGVSYGTPVETYSVPADAAPADAVPVEAAAPEDNSASIKVHLPADAKVFVNDKPTTSTGTSRSYVSNGLHQGRSYSYKLRVEYERDGQVVVEDKVLELHSGDQAELSFGNAQQEQVAEAKEPVKTALNLKVPENARVFLSNAPTKRLGAERSYITQGLAVGEQWDGYNVRVELDVDGETLVQERTLQIEGGQTYELAFDFDNQDAVQLAQLDK